MSLNLEPAPLDDPPSYRPGDRWRIASLAALFLALAAICITPTNGDPTSAYDVFVWLSLAACLAYCITAHYLDHR